MSHDPTETRTPRRWSTQRIGRALGNAAVTTLAVYGWIQFCEEVLLDVLF